MNLEEILEKYAPKFAAMKPALDAELLSYSELSDMMYELMMDLNSYYD